jgi:hypothetical protein
MTAKDDIENTYQPRLGGCREYIEDRIYLRVIRLWQLRPFPRTLALRKEAPGSQRPRVGHRARPETAPLRTNGGILREQRQFPGSSMPEPRDYGVSAQRPVNQAPVRHNGFTLTAFTAHSQRRVLVHCCDSRCRFTVALANPWSAALRYQLAATSRSIGTPRPCSYI